jgi:hypothetical protein
MWLVMDRAGLTPYVRAPMPGDTSIAGRTNLGQDVSILDAVWFRSEPGQPNSCVYLPESKLLDGCPTCLTLLGYR